MTSINIKAGPYFLNLAPLRRELRIVARFQNGFR